MTNLTVFSKKNSLTEIVTVIYENIQLHACINVIAFYVLAQNIPSARL